jgi:hypothetical protein
MVMVLAALLKRSRREMVLIAALFPVQVRNITVPQLRLTWEVCGPEAQAATRLLYELCAGTAALVEGEDDRLGFDSWRGSPMPIASRLFPPTATDNTVCKGHITSCLTTFFLAATEFQNPYKIHILPIRIPFVCR